MIRELTRSFTQSFSRPRLNISSSPSVVYESFHDNYSIISQTCPKTDTSGSNRKRWHIAHQSRGVKRRTTVTLDEINRVPQGLVQSGALPPQDDGQAEYPPLLQQVRNNMLKFSHCVLLTRVGGFYELYFEHADEFAPLLNIKKTRRKTTRRSSRPDVSMAGFPAYQLDRYLKILIQDLNKHVAISEEFLNDASTKAKNELQYTRKVTRIITPGTLIDENFMDPWQSNYLLSIHIEFETARAERAPPQSFGDTGVASAVTSPHTDVGLAWIDLSSGEFLTQSTNFAALPSIVARIRPKEILLDSALQEADSSIASTLRGDGNVLTFQNPVHDFSAIENWTFMLEDTASSVNTSMFTPAEVAAVASLLHYVQDQLLGSNTSLRSPVKLQMEEHMSIDKNSLRALEIRQTIRNGSSVGSLLHSLKKTVTKSGTRLLTQRLVAPSMSISMINDRLDLVEEMLHYPQLRQNIMSLLKQTFDSPRLVTKFSYNRGDADDLIELSKTISTTAEIVGILQEHITSQSVSSDRPAQISSNAQRKECIKMLEQRIDLKQSMKLAHRIENAIDEEGLSEYHRIEDEEASEMANLTQSVIDQEALEGDSRVLPRRIESKPQTIVGSFKSANDGREDIHIMKRSASSALGKLHRALDVMQEEKGVLEEDLRQKLGTESLLLKWTPHLAHIAYVKGKDTTRAAEHYPRALSSSRSTRSFQVPEWTRLGAQMDETRYHIRREEQRILNDLRKATVKNIVQLRRNAAILDELDVACSFAILANDKNFHRPILRHEPFHNIVGGRHPVVEVGLEQQGRKFAPNDCMLDEKQRIWLITGPNMAGKSTYLRQNALISILAQTGSFVPAEYAEIGIVDKIFSRVGSADDLYQDQSTFMVEMIETAQILKEATNRSFVIMDEVGRGTTPEDGIAVGYACLHHLYHINKCRALFATHFHALADMTASFEKMACYCNDVQEGADGSFSYIHRLQQGVNRKSHALKVARLAGVPEEAITIAARVLGKSDILIAHNKAAVDLQR